MDKAIIMFDVGDTLLYRTASRLDQDVEFLSGLSGLSPAKVKARIEAVTQKYPWFYDYSQPIEDRECIDLVFEKQQTIKVLREITKTLGVKQDPETLYEERLKSLGYQLFDNTLPILGKLSEGYKLGVVTNGRPSRRIILEMLGVMQFIDHSLIFISDELGLSKYDQQLYDLISSKAEKIYFVDDEEPFRQRAGQNGWMVADMRGKTTRELIKELGI